MKVLDLFAGTGSATAALKRRGAKTGTQGLKDARLRGMLPEALSEAIADVFEANVKDTSSTPHAIVGPQSGVTHNDAVTLAVWQPEGQVKP